MFSIVIIIGSLAAAAAKPTPAGKPCTNSWNGTESTYEDGTTFVNYEWHSAICTSDEIDDFKSTKWLDPKRTTPWSLDTPPLARLGYQALCADGEIRFQGCDESGLMFLKTETEARSAFYAGVANELANHPDKYQPHTHNLSIQSPQRMLLYCGNGWAVYQFDWWNDE